MHMGGWSWLIRYECVSLVCPILILVKITSSILSFLLEVFHLQMVGLITLSLFLLYSGLSQVVCQCIVSVLQIRFLKSDGVVVGHGTEGIMVASLAAKSADELPVIPI